MSWLDWFRKKPEAVVPELLAPEPVVQPIKKVPTPLRPGRVVRATCSVCKKEVDAFNTYSDGRIKCLPCAIRGK